MKEYTINLEQHELNAIFKGLQMMMAKAERIDKILNNEFTKEFHTNSLGVLNQDGQKLLEQNTAIKITVADIFRKIENLIN